MTESRDRGVTGRMVVIAIALAVAWVGAVWAAATPAQQCEVAKNKAAGNKAKCLTNERAKEVKGKTPDYAKCATKFSAAWAKAEAKFALSCPTIGDTAAIEARIDAAYNSSTGLPKALTGGARFVDNGNGTVTDTATGLMWERKNSLDSVPNLSNPRDADNSYSWSAVLDAADGAAYTDFLAQLNDATAGCFAGQCDWRLPTKPELQSLVVIGLSPSIDAVVFGPTKASSYWSSSTIIPIPHTAWAVDFSTWTTTNGVKTNSLYVRAVRGGS